MLMVLAFAVAVLLEVVVVAPAGQWLDALTARIAALGAWGPALFVMVYVVATVAMIPGSALTLAAGALFGPVWGTVLAALGANGGAASAFLIARYVARGAVARAAARDPRLRALDDAVTRGGWQVVALLRLSPALPFNVQNYLYGLTGIAFAPCALATAVAMLPGAALYATLGAAGRAGLGAASGRRRTPAEWALLGLGVLATVAVTVLVTRLARTSLAAQSQPIAAGPPANAAGGPT
jgi:uncharacterized membrane protein YdjX (TVP38/TMEM64 family)